MGNTAEPANEKSATSADAEMKHLHHTIFFRKLQVDPLNLLRRYPPFAVFLNKDDTNYFEPDISVICEPSKLDDRGVQRLIHTPHFTPEKQSNALSIYVS